MRENITPFNVMEMKTDVTKQIKNDVTLLRAVICCRIINGSFSLRVTLLSKKYQCNIRERNSFMHFFTFPYETEDHIQVTAYVRGARR